MNDKDSKITLQDECIKMDATIIKDNEGTWLVNPVDGSKVRIDSNYYAEGTLTNSVQFPKNKFEKVSWKQFKTDVENTIFPYLRDILNYTYEDFKPNGRFRNMYDAIQLPRRSTKNSAGYDFFNPFESIPLYYGESVTIPTGIKMEIIPGHYLALYPRSSYGFKYKMRLDNTVGIIDADYYNNKDNEGHIMVKVTCERSEPEFNLGKPALNLGQGFKFAQGIISIYGLTCDDDPCNSKRTGGFGSTGK